MALLQVPSVRSDVARETPRTRFGSSRKLARAFRAASLAPAVAKEHVEKQGRALGDVRKALAARRTTEHRTVGVPVSQPTERSL